MRIKNQVVVGVVRAATYLILGLVVITFSLYGIFFSENLVINIFSVVVLSLFLATVALDLLLDRVKTVG